MCRYRQRGIALPLVVVGLLAMLAIAGLALDGSHALANKTRLQNFVDAAALTAAKELSLGADTAQATAAAISLLGQNADGPGNHEFNDAYDADDISVTIQYSETVNPFTPGALNGPFVRVIAENFNILTTLSKVVGVDQLPVAASAVAGPSPPIQETCDIAPLVVCAENMEDREANPPFGFSQDELRVLKPQPGQHDEVGPGNYKLLRLDCDEGGGGACVRQNMAGANGECLTSDQTVETEPGVTAGPTSQGFNTRFAQWDGGGVNPVDHPQDVVLTTPVPELTSDGSASPIIFQDTNEVEWAHEIGYDYLQYVDDTTIAAQNPNAEGAPFRRVMTMPVADCSGDETGQSTLTVEGFACFFMLQPVAGGNDKQIFGQFVDSCLASGMPGTGSSGGNSFTIQLYKDPDSDDS
jgi:hypothetical protein